MIGILLYRLLMLLVDVILTFSHMYSSFVSVLIHRSERRWYDTSILRAWRWYFIGHICLSEAWILLSMGTLCAIAPRWLELRQWFLAHWAVLWVASLCHLDHRVLVCLYAFAIVAWGIRPGWDVSKPWHLFKRCRWRSLLGRWGHIGQIVEL